VVTFETDKQHTVDQWLETKS